MFENNISQMTQTNMFTLQWSRSHTYISLFQYYCTNQDITIYNYFQYILI